MRPIRRSRSAGALLAVGLLFAASACGADPPEPLQSQSTTGAVDITDESDTTSAPTTSAPATTDAQEPASTVQATPVRISAPFEQMSDAYGTVNWLVPWDDGFLAVGVSSQLPLLPDQLPPEIVELFPPEVVELFPDGLPPTREAAIEILRDAGLLEVVTDILDEHPEAMDAITSVPRSDPELTAAWTADGNTWIPTELSPPENLGEVSQLTVSGDHLTVAGAVRAADPDAPWVVAIASTTDLENWNAVSLPVPLADEGTAPWESWVSPIAVAADDEHWVVRIFAAPDSSSPAETELWSAAWGADPTMVGTGEPSNTLLATSEGFVDIGDGVSFSPDGQTWTEVAAPPNARFHAAAPMGDDVLAIATSPDGHSSIYVLDAAGTVIDEKEYPELDEPFSWTSMSSPAFIVGSETSDAAEQMPQIWLLATDDGETWLLEPLDDIVLDTWGTPALVATNGTDVLVRTNDAGWGAEVWQRFTMPL